MIEVISPISEQDVEQSEQSPENTEQQTPYEVLGVSETDRWSTIQKAFTDKTAVFSDTLVSEMPKFSNLKAAEESVESQAKIVSAFEELQEEHFDRSEYLSEAKDLPSLLRRLDILMDHGKSFLTNVDGSLYSVAGAQLQINNILRTAMATVDARIAPRRLLMISDEHKERTLLEKDLPIVQQALKKIQEAENISTVGRSLAFLQRLGFEKFPIWDTKNSPILMDLAEELDVVENLKVLLKKRPRFAQTATAVYKKSIGMRVLSAGIEPTSEVPETPVLSVEL